MTHLIINLYDSLNAFVEKLELWKMHVMKDVFVMFDRLSAVIRANESINISAEVSKHLCKLEEELNHYFPKCIVMNENLKNDKKSNQCKLLFPARASPRRIY